LRNELQSALAVARQIPQEDLPKLLGELEEIRCTALARLTICAPATVRSEELLDVDEAARRLGMSKDHLYRHQSEFSFVRHIGRSVRFSARGIDEYIKTARAH
jgi:excisionase family DNA binding protein